MLKLKVPVKALLNAGEKKSAAQDPLQQDPSRPLKILKLNTPIETPPKPTDKQFSLHEFHHQKSPQLSGSEDVPRKQRTTQTLHQNIRRCLISSYETDKNLINNLRWGLKAWRDSFERLEKRISELEGKKENLQSTIDDITPKIRALNKELSQKIGEKNANKDTIECLQVLPQTHELHLNELERNVKKYEEKRHANHERVLGYLDSDEDGEASESLLKSESPGDSNDEEETLWSRWERSSSMQTKIFYLNTCGKERRWTNEIKESDVN